MKFFSKLLAAAVLCLPLIASAQFVQPPTIKSAFYGYSIPGVGTNVITVAAATTNLLTAATNGVPAQYAQIIPVGAAGFGVHVLAAGVSGAATNTLAFEYTGDGVTWVSQPLIQVYVTNYTTVATVAYTNFPPTIVNAGNLAAIRLKYITNSTGQLTYWTNIMISTR
jgi:hypothetical protein